MKRGDRYLELMRRMEASIWRQSIARVQYGELLRSTVECCATERRP